MAANIIDINKVDIATIDKKEVFAIDTNVLIWTHYSKASNPSLRLNTYQVNDYPNFIDKLLSNGNKIVTTYLNLSELCGVVERNEYRIYKALHGMGNNFKIKDFRDVSEARNDYKVELKNMLLEINATYDSNIDIVEVNDKVIKNFSEGIDDHKCDVFDYAIIQYLKSINIYNYISDDKDYSTIDGINLYRSLQPI